MRILRKLLVSWLANRLPSPGSGSRHPCAVLPGVPRGAVAVVAPNLRPHVTMLDLLFCMVMFFAFQMGQPVDDEVEVVGIESRKGGPTADDEREFLLLRPRFAQGRWRYREDSGGQMLAPEDILARAREGSVVPVFVLDGGTSLRRYLDAEAPLRDRGLEVEIVVTSRGNEP